MATSYLFFFLTYPPGHRSITSQARINIQKRINETRNSLDTQVISPRIIGRSSSSHVPPSPFSAYSRSSKPKYNSTSVDAIDVDLDGLIKSANFSLKVIGLRKDSNHWDPPFSTLDLQLKANATRVEIRNAIKDAGVSSAYASHVFSSRLIPVL